MLVAMATLSFMPPADVKTSSQNEDETYYVWAYAKVKNENTYVISDVYNVTTMKGSLSSAQSAGQKLGNTLCRHLKDEMNVSPENMSGTPYWDKSKENLLKKRQEFIDRFKQQGYTVKYPNYDFEFSYNYRDN
jgi:hypothetical protein